MARRRFLLEIGSGVDLNGMDYTKAARRAIEDAMRRTSLCFVEHQMAGSGDRVYVNAIVGVPNPQAVSKEALQDAFPFGQVDLQVVRGGLEFNPGDPEDQPVVANAIVSVEMDVL